MSNSRGKKKEIGRVIVGVVMFLFSIVCFATLSEGFTLAFLLLGIVVLVFGAYNFARGLGVNLPVGSKKKSAVKGDFDL